MAGPQTATSLANVYATNVPGIGIKVLGSNANHPMPMTPAVYSWNGPLTSVNNVWDSYGYQLVKTGPVTGGTLSFSGAVASAWMSSSTTTLVDVGSATINSLYIDGSTNLVSSGCSVSTTNATVTMPALTIARVAGAPVGATFNPTPFNLAMICATGIKVSYQIDGVSSVYSQSNGVLNNSTGTGMAAGVGIQILTGTGSNPPPLPLSTETLAIITTSSNQSVSIPLIAQYYKTATSVSPGQIQVLATFSMYYE